MQPPLLTNNSNSDANTMVPKPVNSAEDALVQRLHAAVGGPAALSAMENPVATRRAVLAALASQQGNHEHAKRVLSGDLTALERRAVRTVTNRGAAVRSRVRQRRELELLREQVRRKDEQVRRLEAAICDLSARIANVPAYNMLLPLHLIDKPTTESDTVPATVVRDAVVLETTPAADSGVDTDLLANLFDEITASHNGCTR